MTHVPEKLCLALADVAHIDTFIETGTYVGHTALWASQHFKRVITIEADEKNFKRAKQGIGHIPNIEMHLGKSESTLFEVMASLNAPAMIWLDAHHPTGDKSECPLMEELWSISNVHSGELQNVIMIDDAHYICQPPPKPWNHERWPSLGTIMDALPEGYEMALVDSVLVCVPLELWGVIVEHGQNRSVHARIK